MAKLSKELAVAAIQGMEAEEVFVLTPAEHTELLDNYKKTQLDAFERDRVTEIYRGIDRDFLKATGVKIGEGQKTYEFWPDLAKQFKEKADTAAAEVEKLKSTGSPDLLKEIEAIRKASIENENVWKAKVETMQKDLVLKDIKGTLDVSTRDLKLQNLPKPVVDTFIESAKNRLAQSAKIVEGVVVFMDSDGSPKMNKETFKPYTAAELMALELEPIIDKATGNKGGGSEPPRLQRDKDGKLDINMVIPTSVRKRTELTGFLIQAGLPMNTPEHAAAYDKYSVNLPI
jgi:hypothetical protein